MILILNGPIGIGKDTIADLLTGHGYAKTEFKHDLYVETSEYYKVPLLLLKKRNRDRELKELPWVYRGVELPAPRRMLQIVSEQVIKPKFGSDYFGKKAAERVSSGLGAGYEKIVFSDSGFEEEVACMRAAFPQQTKLIRLESDGFDFDSATDTRKYLASPDLTVRLVRGKPQLATLTILAWVLDGCPKDFVYE